MNDQEIMYINNYKTAQACLEAQEGYKAYKNFAIVLMYILFSNNCSQLIHKLNSSYSSINRLSDKEKKDNNKLILDNAKELSDLILGFMELGKADFLKEGL